jgi:hypothetical protein
LELLNGPVGHGEPREDRVEEEDERVCDTGCDAWQDACECLLALTISMYGFSYCCYICRMRCTRRYRLRRHSMMLLLLRSASRHQYGGRVAGGWMRSRGCSLTVPTLGMASKGKLSRAPMLEM